MFSKSRRLLKLIFVGTIIGSARCAKFRERSGRLIAAYNLLKYNITNLVVIGGDGSLTGAKLFREEWPSLLDDLVTHDTLSITKEKRGQCAHLNIVGMVGSIDNDFCGTDMTIGTDSALHRIIEAIDATSTTASSHQRTFILEVMGRHCGYLALIAALAGEADFVFIPESPPENWQESLCEKLKEERKCGKRLNIIIIAEGALDRQGKAISAEAVKQTIVDRKLEYDTRITVLGHVQRGGNPSAFDRILSCRMGAKAVLTLAEAKPDSPAYVVTLDGNQAIRLDLMECVKTTQAVSKAMGEKKWEEATKLRGTSFERNFKMYKMLTQLHPPTSKRVPSIVVGIVHLGDPCCGMNAAVRSAVRTLTAEGITVVGIYGGIDGLMKGDIHEIEWNAVNGWISEGGAKLGATRTLCNDSNLEKIRDQLKKFEIKALIGIGGFDTYQAFIQLTEARSKHDELKIPLVVIPATISNNVPGTDFTIGSDTAVNENTRTCDILRQSAHGGKRVYIIETMGGYCGYLATLAGLASGADASYIHEKPITLSELKDDVDHIKAKMQANIVQHGLILSNEYRDGKFNTDYIKQLYSEAGKGIFSVKTEILGDSQLGLKPSPFDRNLGTKMGYKASQWIMKQFELAPEDFNSTKSSVVLGLRGKEYKQTPLLELKEQTDFE